MLVSQVTPVCWVRTAFMDLKDIREVKGTEDEAETQAGWENQACPENQDIQVTGVPGVFLEKET